MYVVHIIAHMGGGAGKAVSDIIINDKRNKHSLIVLQKPEKMVHIDKCIDCGIDVVVCSEYCRVITKLNEADIIIVQWWHHPLMASFLAQIKDLYCRIILWSHVSGCTYPFLSFQFANIFNKVLVTSSYSYDNKYWSVEERAALLDKIELVYGLGQLNTTKVKVEYGFQNEIRIGYIGTLSKSKIHPDIINLVESILNENERVVFYFVGDVSSNLWLMEKIENSQFRDRIRLTGYVPNVYELLADFDIFVYPLNPYHYATTENSILEAMSVGVPVVLLNQATEKYIISQNEDGILADNLADMKARVDILLNDYEVRKNLGLYARENVNIKFNFEKNLIKFQDILDEVFLEKKKTIKFDEVIGKKPIEWFKTSMNPDDILFFEKLDGECKSIFLEKSKSSLYHFEATFPNDIDIKNIISKVEDRVKNDYKRNSDI